MELQRFSGIVHMTEILPMMRESFLEEKDQERKERLEFMDLCLERCGKPVKSFGKRSQDRYLLQIS